jgi:hypothetical protein
MTTKQIKSVIKKLPHSEYLVPFTYHHNYLRGNCPALAGWSRADIANSTVKFDNQELYALALCQIIDLADPFDIVLTVFTDEDRAIIRECTTLAKERVAFYNRKFANVK